MFKIDTDKTIHITRGDMAIFEIRSKDEVAGEYHTFKAGDVVRLTVVNKGDHGTVVLRKDVKVQGDTTVVDMILDKEDTKIGEIINKPKVYWYEVELNPDTAPQTIIGYDDEDGAKVFKLYPEGSDSIEY